MKTAKNKWNVGSLVPSSLAYLCSSQGKKEATLRFENHIVPLSKSPESLPALCDKDQGLHPLARYQSQVEWILIDRQSPSVLSIDHEFIVTNTGDQAVYSSQLGNTC